MEEIRNKIVKKAKIVLKTVGKILLIPILIICIIIILLSSFVYFITIDDGTYKEDDWESPGYGSAVYQSQVTVNSDGTMTAGKTAQEIWDELIKNGSNVDKYLDGPEDLLKLMNAELITKFPDMRSDPDEEIDWEKVDLENNDIQGIIKFKRADKDGNTSTMKYVDSGTFYDWIEKYNLNGDEEAKKNILSHFILVPSKTTTKVDFSDEVIADISEAIVEAAQNTPSPGGGLCQSWVRQVYVNAGLENVGYIGAYQAFQSTCVSTDRNNIPVGAAVYGTGSAYLSDGTPNIYGHVGIYVGDIDNDGEGDVMDNVGSIRTISLSEWIKSQEESGNTLCGGVPGWLGWGWQSGSPNIVQNETDNSEEEKSEDGKIQTEAKRYCVEVAAWRQVDTTIETNDPDVEEKTTTAYSMSTTQVNYRELVDKYTMPFNLLWAFLVVGEDDDFVLELADLVYKSEIEITVHDNYTKNTDIETWKYTKNNKNEVSATATETTKSISRSTEFEDIVKKEYETKKTIVTQTNTLDVSLTKANTWVVDCEVKYNQKETKSESDPEKSEVEGTEYPEKPNSTSDTYEHKKITDIAVEVSNKAREQGVSSPNVVKDIKVKTYSKYEDITKTVEHKVETTNYISEPATVKEKTDPKAEESNFVKIFKKKKYENNRNRILSVENWLFEIIERNEDTTDMLDLVKYLLYKATGANYGVTEIDFNLFYPSKLTSVGADDYIVHTDQSPKEQVITDVNKLKQAFAGYSGSSKLIENAEIFLELQETYKVNAIFAAAVSISETSAGRAGNASNGKNNWFNIECTCGSSAHGRFETYSSTKSSIEAFYKLIANGSYYFTKGNYSVRTIGMIYCENADAPGGWIENTTTFMTQMFNAAGIDVSTFNSGEKGENIVSAAKSKLGCPYVWGAEGPSSFDCSGLTMWCYKQIGISIPHNTDAQKNAAKKVVEVSKARVGDILYRNGHVAIYIGNDQYIHAPQTGDVVKISKGINSFTYALQFF